MLSVRPEDEEHNLRSPYLLPVLSHFVESGHGDLPFRFDITRIDFPDI